ncbi:MAG: L,D-transpeptidase [Verrucomicrobiota bacterium]
MKHLKSFFSTGPFLVTCLGAGMTLLLTSCATKPENDVPASMMIRYGAVQNSKNLEVRVSLNNRAVYVLENGEPRFVAAVTIGKPTHPTPVGDFKVQHKEAKKRSSIYGFFVKGDEVIPGKRSNMPAGYRYVGYPLPYWVYFAHDCGFHAGAVWPEARTHGCLRLHRTIAREFYNLVEVGTPVRIRNSWPEDSTVGQNVPRPTDYDHPDSSPALRASDAVFTDIERVYF